MKANEVSQFYQAPNQSDGFVLTFEQQIKLKDRVGKFLSGEVSEASGEADYDRKGDPCQSQLTTEEIRDIGGGGMPPGLNQAGRDNWLIGSNRIGTHFVGGLEPYGATVETPTTPRWNQGIPPPDLPPIGSGYINPEFPPNSYPGATGGTEYDPSYPGGIAEGTPAHPSGVAARFVARSPRDVCTSQRLALENRHDGC